MTDNLAISPRPWVVVQIMDDAGKPKGHFGLCDATMHCFAVVDRQDDAQVIVEAVNAYKERPVLIKQEAQGRA